MSNFSATSSKVELAFLQAVYKSADIGICVTDQHRRFVLVNDAYCTTYGYSREELIGQPFTMVVPEDQRELVARLHDEYLAGGDESPGEWRVRRKDGDIRDVYVTTSRVITEEGGRFKVTTVTDITERKRIEDRLRQSANAFEYASEGIVIADAEGTILDVNNAFTRITGYEREEAVGLNPRILRSGMQDREFYERMFAALKRDGEWSSEVWNQRRDGRLFAAMQTISTIRDEAGEIHRYIYLFADITPLKENKQRLERMAHYDPLTGLPNRSLLTDRLRQAMIGTERESGLLAVAYLDLDSFKAINDTYGHARGDAFLSAIAEQMQGVLRESDTLARIGGDEFVLVLPGLSGRTDAELVTQRLLEVAARPVSVKNLDLISTASIGLTFYPQAEALEPDQLVRQADHAMYAAKQAGKNRLAVFDPAHDQAVRGQHEVIEGIRAALSEGQLVLHYQPKVNMQSGAVVGVEALIRWANPEQGLLAPAAFLPAIERSSVAIEVGDWVLETAAELSATWRRSGRPLPVSINVDGHYLAQPNFLSKLRDCLNRNKVLQPGDLELEILESNALDDIDHVRSIINTCEELGVGFALDDFGTGYSTLTHLKRLPAPLLKIDRSFVHDMLDDPDDLAILHGIQGLANAFRRHTIAEGVETTAHGSILLTLGCQLGQGFGIARPMPAEELPAWIETWQPDPRWLTRERVRVRSEDLSTLLTVVEHRAWLIRLKQTLQSGTADPKLSPVCFRFDRWLRERAPTESEARAVMEQMEKLHGQLHVAVANLMKADTALEETLRKRLLELSDELLACTEELFTIAISWS